MLSTFKAQLKIQFEDLEFNDFSDAVLDEFEMVNIATMTLFVKRKLGVSQTTIEKIAETKRNSYINS